MNVSEFRQDANDTGFYSEENIEPDDIGEIGEQSKNMEDEDCGSEMIGSAFFVFKKKIQNIRNRMNGTKTSR